MKHIYLVLILLLSFSGLHAKKIDYKAEYHALKQQVIQLQEQTREQQDTQRETTQSLESIKNELGALQDILKQQKTEVQHVVQQQQRKMKTLSDSISISNEKTLDTIQQNKQELIEKIHQQESNVSSLHDTGKRYIYLIWLLVLGLVGVLVWNYWKNNNYQNIVKQLKSQIQKNKDDINLFFQEQINLCHQILDDNKDRISQSTDTSDFSLALKVADEITLMERNMSYMDPSIKGFKQLKRSIETLKDKLNSQGYEMPELLGKKFNSGMKLTVVSTFPTPQLAHGEEVISKVIKPQVNYKGKMIQSAQVEVSIGE